MLHVTGVCDEAGLRAVDRAYLWRRQFLNPFAFDDLSGDAAHLTTMAEEARGVWRLVINVSESLDFCAACFLSAPADATLVRLIKAELFMASATLPGNGLSAPA